MKALRYIICVLALAGTGLPVLAEALQYEVSGVKGELRRNIRAWLGPAPDTALERKNFLASGEERSLDALRAVGYYRAKVRLDVDERRDPWRLRVVVDAGEPVLIDSTDIRILGDAADDQNFTALLESSALMVGGRLHHGDYEKFKRSLISLGQQRGYLQGKITAGRVTVSAAGNGADVTLYYDSGPRFRFGELIVDESVVVSDLVARAWASEPGDYYELASLQRFRGELQQTGYFSSVRVTPEIDQAVDGEVPVSVQLTPASRHSFGVGVGFSTDTQERISFVWQTPLLNRYGHSQETRLEYSPVQPSGRFTYNIPLSHPVDDVLQLSARLEDREYGDVDSRQKGLRVSRELKLDEWVASYSLRSLDESWNVAALREHGNYVLPGASLSHKSRSGSLVDPSSGLHQAYLLEFASAEAGSDIDLLRFYSSFRYVNRLSQRHRLVARAELGAVWLDNEDRPQLSPSLNFFTGGSQSIRGYSYQSIGNEIPLVRNSEGAIGAYVVGGDRLVVASLEYQYYLNDNWRPSVFLDAGDAFDEGEYDQHVGAGVGIHYMTPVGAFRLELARNVSEDNPSWRFHFNIGAEF